MNYEKMKNKVKKSLKKINAIDEKEEDKYEDIIDCVVKDPGNRIENNKDSKDIVSPFLSIVIAILSLMLSASSMNMNISQKTIQSDNKFLLNNISYNNSSMKNFLIEFLFGIFIIFIVYAAYSIYSSIYKTKYFYVSKCWEKIKVQKAAEEAEKKATEKEEQEVAEKAEKKADSFGYNEYYIKIKRILP